MLNKQQLSIILKDLFNSVLISLTLVGWVWYYQEKFQAGYFALMVLPFSLTLMIDPVDFGSNWTQTVGDLLSQSFWLISLILLFCFAFDVTDYFSRPVLFSWFLSTPGVLVTAHLMARFFLHQFPFAKSEKIKAVIVGVSDLSLKLANELNQNQVHGVTFLGFFDDRCSKRLQKKTEEQSEALLGKIASAAKFVITHEVQQIYIALPMTSQPRILTLLDDFRDTTASIYFVPDIFLFDLIQAKLKTIKDIHLLAVCESPFIGINNVTKRIMDVTLSISILLLVSPLMLLIAAGIKLSSPGSVLFKQRRYGLDGKEILVYKFRTMTVMEDSEQVNQAIRNDPRITWFGGLLRKTSLDELPQFINVLQGRMSIVGPRPHAVSHNEMYRNLIKGYMVRHKVKPGITGWAQIKGFRGETNTVEKMKARIDCDLYYLRNWSFFLDLMIIFKTFGVVIKGENAF